MRDWPSLARDLNALSGYLARRDLEELTPEGLSRAAGTRRIDLLILFGGSILEGIDLAAQAYLDGLCESLMVVGGIGHTTQALRDQIGACFPGIDVAGKAEADVILPYLKGRFGIRPEDVLVENRSTNCGENAEFARKILQERRLNPQTVLLMQDSSMQRRMHATMERAWPQGQARFFSYAAYRATVAAVPDGLVFRGEPIRGLWRVERFISLQMGEIPRLRDDEEGYGPRGKGYIVPVDIPRNIEQAFARLKAAYTDGVRPPWQG